MCDSIDHFPLWGHYSTEKLQQSEFMTVIPKYPLRFDIVHRNSSVLMSSCLGLLILFSSQSVPKTVLFSPPTDAQNLQASSKFSTQQFANAAATSSAAGPASTAPAPSSASSSLPVMPCFPLLDSLVISTPMRMLAWGGQYVAQ